MKQSDTEYARYALKQYHTQFPEFDLMNEIRKVLNDKRPTQ